MPHPGYKSAYEVYRAGETTLEIDTMIKLVLVVRGYRGLLDEQLRDGGQSVARMETLGALLNLREPVSQRDLARRLRVEGATISRMVDLLHKEGLVARSPHPTDRRVNLISITEAGEAVVKDIFDTYDRVRHHMLRSFDRAEIAELNRMASKLLGRLDEPLAEGFDITDAARVNRLRD